MTPAFRRPTEFDRTLLSNARPSDVYAAAAMARVLVRQAGLSSLEDCRVVVPAKPK